MDNLARKDGLLAEIERLKEELAKAREREREFEKTRRAMLYLLEDNNAYAEGLLISKQEWEATFDSILDPIFIHDGEMKILKCNRAYQAVSGLHFKEIIGKPYYEVFPGMSGPFRTCVEKVAGILPAFGTEEVAIPEMDRVYKVNFYPISGGNATSIHVMKDITEEKRNAERERALFDFSQGMTELDLEFRLKRICETAVRFGFRMAWIGLLEHDPMKVIPKAQAGFDQSLAPIKAAFDGDRHADNQVSMALNSLKPATLNNISGEERSAWGQEAFRRGCRSSAALPVIEAGKPIGVLSVYSTKNEFPEKEVPFLQTFANQTAVYIRNARLFSKVKETSQRMKEEMEISKHLLAISFATAHTTDIDKLMEHVVGSLGKIMETDSCLSFIWDRERKSFQPSMQKGLPPEAAPVFSISSLKPGEPFIKKALHERAPALIRAADDPAVRKAFEWIPGLDTLILIPLIRKDEWLGLLFCVYTGSRQKYEHGMTERDAEVLGGISYQVSTALDEARLYQESIDKTLDLSRKVETIKTMNEIDKSILSTLESKEILEIAARMVSRVVPCDRATVALVDREKGGFIYEAGFGISIEEGSLVEFSETTATELLKTGRPQFVPDLSECDRLPFEENLFKQGFLSHLRVPLAVRREVVGVLSVGAKRKAAFTSDDLSIIEKLAYQIGVALANARLVSDLGELFLGTVRTLSEAIDAKSPWTKGHSDRVTKYALDIGRHMGFTEDELNVLELAGRLHDIGKLGTYEAILDKPGKLTEEEFNMIKKHPQKGADILAPIRQLQRIVPAIKHHHETFNGSGYPDGIRGGDIPLMARILAVADTVDAMSADRPYRQGKPLEVIVAELKRCSGTQFDPDVVDAFLDTVEREGTVL